MQLPSPLNVLIIDNQPIFSWGLSTLLSTSQLVFSVQILTQEQNVFSFIKEHKIDVILMELDISQLQSIELIQTIHADYPHILILVMGNQVNEVIIQKALHLGASGFISKSKKIRDFNVAFTTITMGDIYLPEEWTGISSLSSDIALRDFLPTREKEVLQLISKGKSSKEIASCLFLSTHTVNTYRKRLFKRFEVNSAIDLIEVARQNGVLT